jgi:uncharacterized membrane protein required for colicin V production
LKKSGPAANTPWGNRVASTPSREGMTMGLDLALAGLVLLVAIRGWLRGFLVQAIRLAGLVAAAYAAVPVRDFAKPYAAHYLPTIRPDLSDRLLWWIAAVASYFLIVGVASLIVAVSRRNTFGLTEKNRSDQFAGFGLGVVKGLIVASFAVAGLQKYGESTITRVDWVHDQTKQSYSWEWNEKYQPARKIWASQPVQLFVSHVQKHGLTPPPKGEGPARDAGETEKPVQTASRTPKLHLPGIDGPPLEIDTTGLDADLIHEVEALQKQLSKLDTGK